VWTSVRQPPSLQLACRQVEAGGVGPRQHPHHQQLGGECSVARVAGHAERKHMYAVSTELDL
jgi:hypothetical protein